VIKYVFLAGFVCLVSACQSDNQHSQIPSPPPAQGTPALPKTAWRPQAETETHQAEAVPGAWIGRDRDQLAQLLGRPRFIRRDPGLEVWQYDAETCMVEFYLYERHRSFEIVYLEARDYSAALIPSEQCLSSLDPLHRQSSLRPF
jgi:hypothetical protein